MLLCVDLTSVPAVFDEVFTVSAALLGSTSDHDFVH